MPSNIWSALTELINILGGSLSHDILSAIHFVFFFHLTAPWYMYYGFSFCISRNSCVYIHMCSTSVSLLFLYFLLWFFLSCVFVLSYSSQFDFDHLFLIILQISACFCIRDRKGMDSEGREDGEYLVGTERVINIIRIYHMEKCMLNKEVKVRS